jgi:hypothetical protein
MLCADALFALRGRHEQHGNLTGLKDRQVEAERTASGHDDIERRLRLPQARPQFLVHGGLRGRNVGSRPAVLLDGPQGPGSHDHGVGHGA